MPSLFSKTPERAGCRSRQKRRTPYAPGCSAPSLNISEISAESSMRQTHHPAVRLEQLLNEHPLCLRKGGSDLTHCKRHTGYEPGIAVTFSHRFIDDGWTHMSVVLPRSVHFCIGIIIAESNTLAWLLGGHTARAATKTPGLSEESE